MATVTSQRDPGPMSPADAIAVPLLCVGHSHLHCVQAAAAQTGIAIDAVNFWDGKEAVRDFPDDPSLTPALQQRLRDHPGPVFSFVGGGVPAVVGLLSHPRRFDFVLPEAPRLPLDPRAEIVPVDAVAALLREQALPFLKLAEHMRSLARHGLFHFQSPPVCREAQRMLPHIPWPLFPGMRKEIAPPHFRYKIWRLHSQIVAAHCASRDIGFVEYPRQTVDEHRFLLPEYFHDGIHANEKYGALLLQQMRELS